MQLPILTYLSVNRVGAPKVLSIFHGNFAEILALKIESFRNFATIFKIWAKIIIPKL